MSLRKFLRVVVLLQVAVALVLTVCVALTLCMARRWQFESLFARDGFSAGAVALLAVVCGAAVVCAVAGAVAFLKCRRLLNGIGALDKWSETIGLGNLDAKARTPDGPEELGQHVRAIEKMLCRIADGHAALRREALEHKRRVEVSEQRASASRIGQERLSDVINNLKDMQSKSICEERTKALEQVIRGITHDFGEALTPIVATSDLLLACPGIAEDKDAYFQHLHGIQNAAGKARETIRQLAGFLSRVPVPEENVDLNAAVRAAVEQAEAGRNGPSVRLELRDLPPVTGGEQDLRIAVVQIVRNALEAAGQGGAVTVSTRTEASTAIVEVNDTGAGMGDAVRLRAEEPFFSTKGPAHKGMGLTVAAGTFRNHGGDIRIESREGKGTRVILSLPCQTETVLESARAPSQGLRQMNVIVVDDDEATRQVIAFTVSMIGHEVVTATGGEECLDRMEKSVFDIAIVDLAMPGMRGDELAVRIAKAYPLTAIVMLTGFGEVMLEDNDVPEHVDILIAKPVTAAQLASVLEKAPSAHARNRRKQASRNPPLEPGSSASPGVTPDGRKEETFKWHG